MNLSNPHKTEIWIFDIIEDLFGYNHKSMGMGVIKITFTDKRFIKATFPFKGSYTKDEWDLLAQVSGKITEIEKQYNQEEIRGDYPCDATESLPTSVKGW